MTLKSFSGTATKAKLTGAITAGSLVIPCDNLTNWPSSGQFVAVIDPLTTTEEWILCDSKTGTTQLNANASTGRGYVGTAQSHNAGANVWLATDVNVISEANRYVNLMTTKGDLVGWDGSLAQRFAAAAQDQMVLRKLGSGGVGLEWTHLGSLPVFTSTANRDAAVTPVDGQGWYRNTNDVSEGIEFYNGTAYRPPWNLPWGLAAQPIDSSTTQSAITSVTDVTGASITFTAVTRRWYLYSFAITLEIAAAAASQTTIQLTDGANSILAEFYCFVGGTSGTQEQHQFNFELLRQESAGSVTRKLRCSGNASGVDIGVWTPHTNTQFKVEDKGPVTGAPA